MKQKNMGFISIGYFHASKLLLPGDWQGSVLRWRAFINSEKLANSSDGFSWTHSFLRVLGKASLYC